MNVKFKRNNNCDNDDFNLNKNETFHKDTVNLFLTIDMI